MNEVNEVVFHIDDLDKWPLTLNNVNNMRDLSTEKVIILVNSNAVLGLLKEEEYEEQIKAVIDRDVTILACAASIEGLEKTEMDVLSEVIVVPSGVVTLSERQRDGATYIKP